MSLDAEWRRERVRRALVPVFVAANLIFALVLMAWAFRADEPWAWMAGFVVAVTATAPVVLADR